MRPYQVVDKEEVVLCPGDNDMDDGNHNGCGVDFKCPGVNMDGDNANTQAGHGATGGFGSCWLLPPLALGHTQVLIY